MHVLCASPHYLAKLNHVVLACNIEIAVARALKNLRNEDCFRLSDRGSRPFVPGDFASHPGAPLGDRELRAKSL